jgi:hypothetical protein
MQKGALRKIQSERQKKGDVNGQVATTIVRNDRRFVLCLADSLVIRKLSKKDARAEGGICRSASRTIGVLLPASALALVALKRTRLLSSVRLFVGLHD